MCDPGVSLTTTPEELTGLRNQAANATEGCCSCTYRDDGRHRSTGKVKQLRADATTPNGQNDSTWSGEILVSSDGTTGAVNVHHKLEVINSTADTRSYPDTRALTDEVLHERVAKIPPAIASAWNARPYKLKITDETCGERVFNVKFSAEMVTGGGHYEVNFVNVHGMGTRNDVRGVLSGRSYVTPPSRAKFNLDDVRSATDDDGDDVLEPHEYGHMIGLKDEYNDAKFDRGGVIYEFPDGSTETAEANGHLMSSMSTTTAQPERYAVTIAYAVISVLESNGISVTDCEIQ